MPRVRTRPVNAYIQSLMDQYGATTITQLSEKTGIPDSTLRGWSDCDGSHKVFESILDAAQKTGRPVEEIIKGILLGTPAPRLSA